MTSNTTNARDVAPEATTDRMTSEPTRSGLTGTLWGGRLAIAYGVAALVMGAVQAIRPEEDAVAAIDTQMRWLLAMWAVSLVLVVPAYLALARFARSPWGARLVAVGTPILAAGAMSSAVNGEDLAAFPAIATVANALWLVGSVMLGVSLWRAGRVPRWVAVALPGSMPVTLVLSQMGSGLVVGAFWVALGAMLATGTLARREARARG